MPRNYEPVKLDDVDAGLPQDTKQAAVMDRTSLAGRKIALICSHGFEEIEVTYPLEYLEARGAQVDLVTPEWISGRVLAVRFVKPSLWIPSDHKISDVDPAQYDAVIIPGGGFNPIVLRDDEKMRAFVGGMHAAGRLVAAICHGPQVLISCGLVDGVELTGVGDIRVDLRNAGALVHEAQPVVVHDNVLTSRDPRDVLEFSQAIERYLLAAKDRPRPRAAPADVKEQLRELNAEIGRREDDGESAANFFDDLLHEAFVFRRANGEVADRKLFIEKLKRSGPRTTDVHDVRVFGGQAVVSATVTLPVEGKATPFHNLRVFLRAVDGKWKLFAWANDRRQ